MTEQEALQELLSALTVIDGIAEAAMTDGVSMPEDAVAEIHNLTGNVIGDLARAGYEANRIQ